jgi:hypothetical protein
MINTNTQNLSSIGSYLKDIPFLPTPDEYSYENFLRLYLNNNNQFYFNILSTKIDFDGELDTSTYYKITVKKRIPWTTLSYNEYRNINLWWLIMAVNKIYNPIEYPVPGTELKILYPEYVRYVIDIINNKLK